MVQEARGAVPQLPETKGADHATSPRLTTLQATPVVELAKRHLAEVYVPIEVD